MTPHKVGGKEEQWRDWVEEVRGYIDTNKLGMKAVLIEIEETRKT